MRLNFSKIRGTENPYRNITAGLFIVLFAVIGVYLLTGSHAAGPFVSSNADTGSLACGATSKTDTNASDGHYVVLNSGSSTCGGGGGNGSAIVNAAPKIPGTSAGNWKVVFADAFGKPICQTPGAQAGNCDNYWYPNENSSNPCSNFVGNNSNEEQLYNCSQIKQDSSGVHLVDQWSPGMTNGGRTYDYLSGAIQNGTPRYDSQGVQPFAYKLGQGGTTLVFEINTKLPANTGEVDPGWWGISTTRWPPEMDFFEEWGYATWHTPAPTGVTYIEPGQSLIQKWQSLYALTPPGNPETAYHTYTSVVTAGQVLTYIDGQLSSGFTINPGFQTDYMNLIISNALRCSGSGACSSPSTANFQSGSRTYDVRSVAVYEDIGHAGQQITGGGTAPGTTVQ
jgi:hypothetical protein